MASGLGLWLCVVLRVRVCPTAASLVYAQFLLMGKILWDSSSAEEPCMVMVSLHAHLPPAVVSIANALRGVKVVPSSSFHLFLVLCPCVLAVTDAWLDPNFQFQGMAKGGFDMRTINIFTPK